MWTTLIEAVAQNDIDHVMQLGVTNPTDYRSPNSDYMTKRARKAWLEERAAVALSADIDAEDDYGDTALSIAERHKMERDRLFFSKQEDEESRHESEEEDYFPDAG
nr:hypothetical protein BaRGS_029299 [Batillaria attramentaria]